MKKNFILNLFLIGNIFFIAAQKPTALKNTQKPVDERSITADNKQNGQLAKKVSLRYHNTDPINDQKDVCPEYATYTGIRIGEYYWMDSNFNHRNPFRYVDLYNPKVPNDKEIGGQGWLIGEETQHNQYASALVNQEKINTYLDKIFIEREMYQVDCGDFEKYYGIHYSRNSMRYMDIYGEMYENGELNKSWKLPSDDDFRQLIGMCEVRHPSNVIMLSDIAFDLAPKAGDNPLSFNFASPSEPGYNVYWFHPSNTNRYGFSMMPGGGRLNGDGRWCNGLGPFSGCWDGKYGDLCQLFYVCKFATLNKDENGNDMHGALDFHDWFTFSIRGWHWVNIRWCRPLTDEELGYKLYINKERTDIKKIDMQQRQAIPAGYSELPKGLLRGLYVQYILDNPNPTKTIADIVQINDRTLYFHENRIRDINEITGIEVNASSRPLFVYPNPATDVLNIESDGMLKSVELYDMNARLVSNTRQTGNRIDVSGLKRGIYSLKVSTNDKTEVVKIMKK